MCCARTRAFMLIWPGICAGCCCGLFCMMAVVGAVPWCPNGDAGGSGGLAAYAGGARPLSV